MAEQSLQLRLAQKLALAPQLQQAIRLLQLNRIELREYIQDVVDANPLLEHDDGTSEQESGSSADASDSSQDRDEPDYAGGDDYGDTQLPDEGGAGDVWQDSGSSGSDFAEPQIADT